MRKREWRMVNPLIGGLADWWIGFRRASRPIRSPCHPVHPLTGTPPCLPVSLSGIPRRVDRVRKWEWRMGNQLSGGLADWWIGSKGHRSPSGHLVILAPWHRNRSLSPRLLVSLSGIPRRMLRNFRAIGVANAVSVYVLATAFQYPGGC